MRRWTIEVTEHELRVILAAMDLARAQWRDTRDVARLYDRLRGHGLG